MYSVDIKLIKMQTTSYWVKREGAAERCRARPGQQDRQLLGVARSRRAGFRGRRAAAHRRPPPHRSAVWCPRRLPRGSSRRCAGRRSRPAATGHPARPGHAAGPGRARAREQRVAAPHRRGCSHGTHGASHWTQHSVSSSMTFARCASITASIASIPPAPSGLASPSVAAVAMSTSTIRSATRNISSFTLS